MENQYVLICKNKFGNYQQFTDENGLQEYKNNIYINHMTGEQLIIEANNLFFIDKSYKPGIWRPPTIEELKKLNTGIYIDK